MKALSKVLAVCLTVLLAGCAISRGAISSYIDPTYTPGTIKSIAVFSIRNASLAPSEARQINKELIRALMTKNPKLRVISPSESRRKINENKLVAKWADFIEDYYTSGIANKTTLAEVAKALNIDAIMQGQILKVYQVDGDGWSQKGRTRVTISFSIIETRTGKTIWEASADGIRGNASASSPAPPVKEAIALAIEKITTNVPKL